MLSIVKIASRFFRLLRCLLSGLVIIIKFEELFLSELSGIQQSSRSYDLTYRAMKNVPALFVLSYGLRLVYQGFASNPCIW